MLWTPRKQVLCPRCGKPKRSLRKQSAASRWLAQTRRDFKRVFQPSLALAMADGDVMLDVDGNKVLDIDGNVILDDGDCTCVCGIPCGYCQDQFPDSFTVSFSVDLFVHTCRQCGSSSSNPHYSNTATSVSHSVVVNKQPLAPAWPTRECCRLWYTDTGGSTPWTLYTNSSCSTLHAFQFQWAAFLNRAENNLWTLIITTTGINPCGNRTVLQGKTTVPSCNEEFVVDNLQTTCGLQTSAYSESYCIGPPPGFVAGVLLGWNNGQLLDGCNGSATVTPN